MLEQYRPILFVVLHQIYCALPRRRDHFFLELDRPEFSFDGLYKGSFKPWRRAGRVFFKYFSRRWPDFDRYAGPVFAPDTPMPGRMLYAYISHSF